MVTLILRIEVTISNGDGILLLQTNGGIGFNEVVDGQTAAWNANGNYGNYWNQTINSASSVDNDCTRPLAEADAIRLRGAFPHKN